MDGDGSGHALGGAPQRAAQCRRRPRSRGLVRVRRQARAHEAVRRLLDQSALSAALLVSNNLMMLGALKAVREAGLRMPHDLAIVGIGDPEWAALVDPPLTMMAVPVRGMPLDAMELLLQRVLHSRDSPRRIIHLMELRVGASHTRFPA